MLSSYASSSEQKKPKYILITQIVDHPALNDVRLGIQAALDKAGLNYELVYQNAQGNPTTAHQIATNFASRASDKIDVVVAISTLSAQTIKAKFKDREVPIIFAAVTDPEAAQLVDQLDKPGGFITGTTDHPPLKEQLQLIRDLMGRDQDKEIRLGVIYNAGEVNSVNQIAQLQAQASSYKMKIIERTAENTTKVFAAASSLVGQVDAFYIPLDNVAASATTSIIQVAMKAGIPVFASDPEGVKQGALATIAPTHYDEGLTAGQMILEILEGKNPGDMAVRAAQNKRVYWHKMHAKILGITQPTSMCDQEMIEIE